MKKLFIGLIICLTLNSCFRTDKEILKLSDLIQYKQVEQEAENPIQAQSEIILPKMEITRENLFAEFPPTPDYFIENDIAVTIERIDNRTSPFPTYYGIEPVYVTGENFFIIYTTDNGYKVRLVELKGKSIFTYWNQFFDATLNDVKKSWGNSQTGWVISYYDSDETYFVAFFNSDKTTGKITEIQIGREL